MPDISTKLTDSLDNYEISLPEIHDKVLQLFIDNDPHNARLNPYIRECIAGALEETNLSKDFTQNELLDAEELILVGFKERFAGTYCG